MFTVATLNLHGRHHRWLERRHLIVNEILAAQPDLVALQEISFTSGQGWWLYRQLNARLGREVYHLVQQRRRHLVRGYAEGIGVLSKLPVMSSDTLGLGYGGRIAVRATVELPTGHAVDFVSTHLHPAAHEPEARLEQVIKLAGWLQSPGSSVYQVIAGSLGEVPEGLAVRQLRASYQSVYAAVNGRDPIATFPTALVTSADGWVGCLDYIFISPTLVAQEATLCFCAAHPEDEWLYPSDHIGVCATLRLRE